MFINIDFLGLDNNLLEVLDIDNNDIDIEKETLNKIIEIFYNFFRTEDKIEFSESDMEKVIQMMYSVVNVEEELKIKSTKFEFSYPYYNYENCIEILMNLNIIGAEVENNFPYYEIHYKYKPLNIVFYTVNSDLIEIFKMIEVYRMSEEV